MKSVSSLAFLGAVFLSACGFQGKSGDSSLEGAKPKKSLSGSIRSIEGKIASVTTKSAKAPAQGIWTEIVLDYDVSCTDKLESFRYTLKHLPSGEVEILASAIVSTPSMPKGAVTCQAFSTESKKVVVSGMLAAQNVKLINLKSELTSIPADTMSLRPVGKMEIIKTEDLCPQNAKCVLDGTKVTLRAHLGCMNKLGPVAFHASRVAKSGFDLTFDSTEFVNTNTLVAQCTRENTEDFVISVQSFKGDSKNFNLELLK